LPTLSPKKFETVAVFPFVAVKTCSETSPAQRRPERVLVHDDELADSQKLAEVRTAYRTTLTSCSVSSRARLSRRSASVASPDTPVVVATW